MGKPKSNLTGMTFNYLTAISEVDKPNGATQSGVYWLFRCVCGNEVIHRGSAVKYGRPQSCGCMKSKHCSDAAKKRILRDFGDADYRFESRIDKSGDCWIFTGGLDKDGYGLISNGYRKTALRAHRYSYEKYHGKIPKDMVVRHKCDNPSCVNPAHLEIGTPKQNVMDMLLRDRDAMVGSRNNKAKLTEADIIKILKLKGVKSYAGIASDYNVSTGTILRIMQGKAWRHVNV